MTKQNNNKKTIFIASSGESKKIAEAVKENFDREAEVDIWTEDIFKLNQSTLDTLMNRASYYDFFIAIFSADDKAVIKSKQKKVTRANVVFEFGLFLGRIGIDRTFFILEDGVELFSDWNGITTTSFVRRDNLVSAVGASCNKIRERMDVADKMYNYTILSSTSLAIGYHHNFLKPVLEAFQYEKSVDIIEKDKLGNVVNKIVYELKNRYPTIEVRVPKKLSTLEKEKLKTFTKSYKQIIIATPTRSFPFYIQGELEDDNDNLVLFDIPTTLYASYLTIQKFFSPNFLATGDIEEKLISKEIRNFEKTLSKLIPDDQEEKLYEFITY